MSEYQWWHERSDGLGIANPAHRLVRNRFHPLQLHRAISQQAQ